MTPASLEALARALARLEPDVFEFRESRFKGHSWALHNAVNDDVWHLAKNQSVQDDALFGAVWRCAVAQGLRPSVMVSHESDVLACCVGTNPTLNVFEARAATPGVALALAYCDARGGKVEGLAT